MGHRYTAMVAYELVDQQTRDSVLKILSFHPDIQAHFFDEKPNFIDENQIYDSNWMFSQMAVWADVIKRKELNYSPQHRRWHYINYPVCLTDIDERYYKDNVPVNVDLVPTEEVSDEWNIAQAFAYNLAILDSAEAGNRALALCWIFHLLGDIHQPLHSSALFNERRFPKGDMGGNAITVKGIGVLHVAWDRSTYMESNKGWEFDQHAAFVQELVKAHKKVGELAQKDEEFEDWLNESHELAMMVGYPKELLEAIRESKIEKYGFGNPLSVKLDKAFTKQWKAKIYETSLQQITKAGYRLAFLLEEHF